MTAANGNDALAVLVAILNRHDIDYMLVGSYSSNAYGIPRATKDADIVVATLNSAINTITAESGDDYQINSQLEFELLTGTLRRAIRFKPNNFVLEIFQLSDDPFDLSRFNRRVKIESAILGGVVWLPTPEDVIVQKLRWSRPQDLMDVSNVLLVQMDALDWSYIDHWTKLHGTTSTLDQIRSEL